MIPAAITISAALIKAFIDFKRWPFENHWVGFVVVAAIVLTVCWIWWVIFPMFLYNVIFNPALNLMKGHSVFYVGDTARTDKAVKKLFGKYAGHVWIFSNLTLLILTI